MRHLFLAALLAPLTLAATAATPVQTKPADALAAAVASPARSAANRARDQYRHPVQTLAFFGVKPGQTVVEIWPGAGWYAEILAPLLSARGHYIAATQPPGKNRDATLKLLAGDPARFGKATTTIFDVKAPSTIAPPGTADVVLTFRNVHNMLMAGDDVAARAFVDFYRALKPGGVLGVEDHRLPESADAALEKTSGYIKRSTVVRLATAAGFKLAAESEVNANPKDPANWPNGVWTLPPTLSQGDVDRAKYVAIGESDRMTLKFVKPLG
ncbi:class I SAM-dependent methyltransferase [Sphingomonas profundi]|uniref:class I SAM-dependent methyltransferase n=1 Tax=Alterirhizorhabdus profundi TaxID=2681549 RepID=UPI0012E9556D|nr:methyltransferase [Sphingomonas profundi]